MSAWSCYEDMIGMKRDKLPTLGRATLPMSRLLVYEYNTYVSLLIVMSLVNHSARDKAP